MDEYVFREYDIRGIYGKDLDDTLMEHIGNVFTNYVRDSVVLGFDNRQSSENLKTAFSKGIINGGKDVIDIGMVPKGVAFFVGQQKGKEVAYITASHDPPKWNGVKFANPNGTLIFGGHIQNIKKLVEKKKFIKYGGGEIRKYDPKYSYRRYVVDNIPDGERALKVLLDCGNGTSGSIVKRMFKEKGFVVDTVFEEPDGDFPHRTGVEKKGLKETIKKADGYDLTMAYDDDADRVVVIDDSGNMMKAEEVALIILNRLRNNKGPIVANVECSRVIDKIAARLGKEVVRTKVGYPFLIEAVRKYDACMGVEKSDHFVIPKLSLVDDGLMVSVFVAYAVSCMDKKLSQLEVPETFVKYENFECDEDKKFKVVDNIAEMLKEKYDNVDTLDGVKVRFSDGWVLVRVSNTSPLIRMSIDADDEKRVEELAKEFKKIIIDNMESVS